LPNAMAFPMSQTETEKADKRVTGKRPKEFPEHLYCTIDGWQRTFRFGVNRFGPIKGILEEVEPYDLWVFPTHVPRKNWRDDPEAIGRVWTQEGKLFGTLRISADTFYSLFPCLASDHFKELELRLLRMHYRQGDIDGFSFRPKETPMEDLLQ